MDQERQGETTNNGNTPAPSAQGDGSPAPVSEPTGDAPASESLAGDATDRTE